MKEELISRSLNETKKLGEEMASYIFKNLKPKNKAVVICLEGELGGGKTTFLQGFARGLKIKDKILSPTFIIMKKFKIRNSRKFLNFYHFDCYRIKDSKELFDLGFKEIISCPKNIVAIEWANQIKKNIPKDSFWIRFEFIKENERKIIFIV